MDSSTSTLLDDIDIDGVSEGDGSNESRSPAAMIARSLNAVRGWVPGWRSKTHSRTASSDAKYALLPLSSSIRQASLDGTRSPTSQYSAKDELEHAHLPHSRSPSTSPTTRRIIVYSTAIILTGLFIYGTERIGQVSMRLSAISSVVAGECAYSIPASEILPGTGAPGSVSPPPLDLSNRRAQLWQSLQALYDSHPPQPVSIPRVKQPQAFREYTDAQLDDYVHLSQDDATRTRDTHRDLVDKIPSWPQDDNDNTTTLFQGRGIVILGGGNYAQYAATALGMLRTAGSRLPVEVWLRDASEEHFAGWCDELPSEGAVCRRLTDYVPSHLFGQESRYFGLAGPSKSTPFSSGYQYKALAMLLSGFEEILLLDADNLVMMNPDSVFDSDGYMQHGAVVWPDYWGHSGTPWLPYLIGLTGERSWMLKDTQTAESGQLLWDKRRHWKSLVLAMYYNYFGPTFWYMAITNGYAGWGDKDTFGTALRALGESFHFIPQGVRTVFIDDTGGGTGMLQSSATDPFGPPMFLHANIIKWGITDLLSWNTQARPALEEGRRVLRPKELVDDFNLDPEPDIWRVVQNIACWSSAMGSATKCETVRRYREKAYGYTPTPSAPKWLCKLGIPGIAAGPAWS